MLIFRLLIGLSAPTLRRRVLGRFVGGEAGQDLVEYALLAAFIGVAGWLALSVIDDAVGSTYLSWLSTTSGAPALWAPAEPINSGS
jgi:Flp pilus assembly pilin Flp